MSTNSILANISQTIQVFPDFSMTVSEPKAMHDRKSFSITFEYADSDLKKFNGAISIDVANFDNKSGIDEKLFFFNTMDEKLEDFDSLIKKRPSKT